DLFNLTLPRSARLPLSTLWRGVGGGGSQHDFRIVLPTCIKRSVSHIRDERQTMDKKRIAVIFLIVLTNAMAATAILPMLPIYVEGQFQATPVQAMLVIAAYYASQFVAAPILGKLSDRLGRRPILIVSQI